MALGKKKRTTGKVVDIGKTEDFSRSDGETIVIEKTDVKGNAKSVFSLLMFFAGIIVFIGISSYLLVSATLMNFTKIDDTTVWNLYGVVPDSEDDSHRLITASHDSQVGQSYLDRATYSITGISKPFVGEVVSDRFDKISSKSGNILINGKKSGYEGKIDSKKLDNEYLVKCISGSCKEDSYLIVKRENIVGNVYGYVTKNGFETVEEK